MECKLARNVDVRRKVVGQVLDYASALCACRPTKSRIGSSDSRARTPWMYSARGCETSTQSGITGSRAALATTIDQGSFRLLIAVDAMDQGLKRIISYVNSRAGSSQQLKLVALTFPMYAQGGIEILVPESYGDEATTALSARARSKQREWSEPEFLELLTDAGHSVAREVAQDLISWMREHGTSPSFGHGMTGPLYVHIPLAESDRSFPLTELGGFGGSRSSSATCRRHPLSTGSRRGVRSRKG